MLPFTLQNLNRVAPVEPGPRETAPAARGNTDLFHDYLQRAQTLPYEAGRASDDRPAQAAGRAPVGPREAARNDRAGRRVETDQDRSRDDDAGQVAAEPAKEAAAQPSQASANDQPVQDQQRRRDAQEDSTSEDSDANNDDAAGDMEATADAAMLQAASAAGQLALVAGQAVAATTSAEADFQTAGSQPAVSEEQDGPALPVATDSGDGLTTNSGPGLLAASAGEATDEKVATTAATDDASTLAATTSPMPARSEVAEDAADKQPEGTSATKAAEGPDATGQIVPPTVEGAPAVPSPPVAPASHGQRPQTHAVGPADPPAQAAAGSTEQDRGVSAKDAVMPRPEDAAAALQRAAAAVQAASKAADAAQGPDATPGPDQAAAGPAPPAAAHSAQAAPSGTPPGDDAVPVDRARLVQRVERAFHSMRDSGGSLRLRLSPPELGDLRIEITVRNGEMTARMQTETSEARNLLLDNLPALRDRLAQQDIKVQRFDVDLMDRSLGGSPDQTRQFAGSWQQGDGGTSYPARRPAAESREPRPTADAPTARRWTDSGGLNVVV